MLFYHISLQCHFLRGEISKFRPEAYTKENTKMIKKIHMMALGKLLPEIYVLLRSGNYLRRTETILVSWVPVFRGLTLCIADTSFSKTKKHSSEQVITNRIK